MKYIYKCDTCVKYLPNVAICLQKHLEIPQIPVAVLAMDTIGHLIVTSRGHKWALTAICMHTCVYMHTTPVKEKSTENVV